MSALIYLKDRLTETQDSSHQRIETALYIGPICTLLKTEQKMLENNRARVEP